jgi:hypothetical protein
VSRPSWTANDSGFDDRRRVPESGSEELFPVCTAQFNCSHRELKRASQCFRISFEWRFGPAMWLDAAWFPALKSSESILEQSRT